PPYTTSPANIEPGQRVTHTRAADDGPGCAHHDPDPRASDVHVVHRREDAHEPSERESLSGADQPGRESAAMAAWTVPGMRRRGAGGPHQPTGPRPIPPTSPPTPK